MSPAPKVLIALLVILTAGFLIGGAASAQAPKILWWYDLDAPSFGSGATADLDKDDKPEIVFGTYFNDERIVALNGEDGSLLWDYNTGGCNDASPVIADVDQDGDLEVVVPASSPCTVFCFDGATGGVEWTASTASHCLDSPPSVADVDRDGKPEVVLGAWGGYVYCLNGEDGSQEWLVNVGTNSFIQTAPAVLDLDGNGTLELVVGQWSGDCRVYALNGEDGSTFWYSDLPTDYMYHGPSFGDIDEDGKPELAIGCYDNTVYVLNGEDGSLCWSYGAPWYVGAPTTLADVDHDGHLEVIYAAYNQVGALSHTGGLKWSYNAPAGNFRGTVVADVDGNGVDDVVFGNDDGVMRALKGNNGRLLWSCDLEAHYGNTFEIDHAPLIADFDGDGKLDVFVVGGWGISSPSNDNHGRAYVFSAGEGTGQGWSMFRHDKRRCASFHGFPALESDHYTLPAGSGGTLTLTLNAGLDRAGRWYLVLGSVSGTSPGLPLPGGQAVLPLNWDWFTEFVVARLNTPMFQAFMAPLDVGGEGTALITMGVLPAKHVGIVMAFAFCLGDPFDMVSNVVEVEIVP